jgi:hypothetical protein
MKTFQLRFTTLLTALLALASVDAMAGLSYTWQYREAYARYGVIDAGAETQLGNDSNYAAGSFAKLLAQDLTLATYASSQLSTSEAGYAGGYAFDVDLNLFLFSQLASNHDAVYSQGYAYWQLQLVSDTPYYFSMTNTLSEASGDGVTQAHHFTNLSGPANGNLLAAGTHYFYGELKYTLSNDTAVPRIIAPSTHASLVLTPVPEPETWAMLLVGLGLVAYRLRESSPLSVKD